MSDKESIRQKALQDSDFIAEKRRFGLFSQPISTAIGDDGPYKTKFHPREDDGKGKPISQARNFQSGPCRSGQMRKSFFTDLNSLASMKDEYIEEPKRLLKEQNENFAKGPKNEGVFKPPSGTGNKLLNKSAYEYTEEKPPQLNPKRNREEDGRVKAKLRNTQTNPGSKVIDSYFKPLKHIDDPYERAHQMKIQQQRKDHSLEGQQVFKPNCFVAKIFNKEQKVYGQDVELKKRPQKQTKFNIYNHENNWKSSNPNKKGLYGFFSPFPTYMENPPRQITRKQSQQKKQIFKAMSSTLTTPTASISGNPINIRKHINHSFSHRM